MSQDSKSDIDFGFFSIIKVINQIIQMIQLQFQTYEVEFCSNYKAFIISISPTTHRDMLMVKNELVSGVESKLNGIIQKRISTILSWIEAILNKQKKSDYNLKEGLLENTVSTSTCNEITNFLRHITDEAFDTLDEYNRDAYFMEIGSSFCKYKAF